MEEVRSYWQVTSITHFCNIFGKQFKLPVFEPEELEQAFILNIPAPPTTNTTTNNHNNHNNNSNNNSDHEDAGDRDDEDWLGPDEKDKDYGFQPQPCPPPQQIDEQQELHLLVKLAIALLKPHFNCKISHANWENYLRRIIDSNWVELEHHPSPFRVPIISQTGVELTKNLTFNELLLSDKIDLFYALCDYRLWCDDAADALKDFTLEELRLESIGKDSHGYEYWYFSGTRLFRENKELSQDIIMRKKRIKELEYSLIDLEQTRIFREQEEKRKAELEKARQLANEAREARIAAKKQLERETTKKRKVATPILPPRTGLRERRSSATSNNNDSQQSRTPSTRSKQAKQQQPAQQHTSSNKQTRSLSKNSKNNDQLQEKLDSPDVPKKSPEEECKDELERLTITREDRAEAWSMQCESLEDWESFAVKFEKTKSTNEKYLSAYINQELLPNIRAVYARRAAEERKKEKELILSLASRRVSTRIITKRAQEEEEERLAQIREAETRQRKVEAETRLRAELEREMRAKRNRFVVNGGTSSTCSDDGEDINGRYKTRQQNQVQNHHNSDDFEGIIHPDMLSEFYEALELVIDTVRTSKHAWPFVDPVPETVPGYYDLIKEPMDLRKLRTKVEFREYKCLIELEKDFQLLVNNCEKFNGPRNVYTKMVYKLWKSFRKNVRLYLQRDLYMDEYETFVYPPPVASPKAQAKSQEKVEPELPVNHDESKQQQQQQPKLEPEIKLQPDPKLEPHDPKPDQQDQPIIQPKTELGLQEKNSTQEEVVVPPIESETPQQNHQQEACCDSQVNSSEPQSEDTLEQQEVPMVVETAEQPPDPIGEEVIIDSYDIPCPTYEPIMVPEEKTGHTIFLWPQDATHT